MVWICQDLSLNPCGSHSPGPGLPAKARMGGRNDSALLSDLHGQGQLLASVYGINLDALKGMRLRCQR